MPRPPIIPDSYIVTIAQGALTSAEPYVIWTVSDYNGVTITHAHAGLDGNPHPIAGYPVIIFYSYGDPIITSPTTIQNGEVIRRLQLAALEENEWDLDIDVDVRGVRIGMAMFVTSALNHGMSLHLSFLPWVDGVRPLLRSSTRRRRVLEVSFPPQVVSSGARLILFTRPLTTPYIVREVQWRRTGGSSYAARVRPILTYDSVVFPPTGVTSSAGAIGLRDVYALTNGDVRNARGFALAYVFWQRARPWTNVRDVPSRVGILLHSVTGTITFFVVVIIEFLGPRPWWLTPYLRELARGHLPGR